MANEGGIGGGVHIAGGGMFDSGAATNSSFWEISESPLWLMKVG